MAGTYHRSKVLLVSTSHMLHDLFGSFLSPLAPLLRESAGISLSQIGWLNVAQGFPTIFNPLIGLKTSQKNIMRIMVLAPALTAVAMSSLGLASSFWSLFILLSIAGVSSALFHVPSPVLIKHSAGDKIGRGMSYYMLGGEIARFIGPLTVLAAVDLWGLKGTSYLMPLGFLASGLLYWRFRKFHIPEPENKQGGISPWQEFRRSFLLLLLVGMILMCISFVRSGITAFLPSFIVEEGGSLWFGGTALAFYQGAGALGTIMSGYLSDRVGRNRVLFSSALLTPIAMYLLLHLGAGATIPALIMLGVSAFAATPVFLAMMQELGSERPAFINGLFMTINFMTSAIASVGIGWLGDRYGLRLTYELLPYLALPGVAFVLLLPKAIKHFPAR
jgi:MFS transporter, FSR family, fosmidomycin resistance protein